MIETCGRFGWDVERVWMMTYGEFESLVIGGKQAERERRLLNARLESVALAFGGVVTSPLAIIGEQDDYGPNPFVDDDPLQRRLEYLSQLEEQAERKHRAWLPKGIVADD